MFGLMELYRLGLGGEMGIKNMLKKIFVYLIFINVSFAADPVPIGDLYINVSLHNLGTTKTYDNVDGKLILDAGVLNKNDSLSELRIAEVEVSMEARKNGDFNYDQHDACTIDGGFTGLLALNSLKDKFINGGREIRLSPLTKYNNADNTVLTLKAQNFRELKRVIRNEDLGDSDYVFSAYPDECPFNNKILSYSYKFDLVLTAENFKEGDIVRGDISLDGSTVKAASGKGDLQALIEDQIKSIMTER